MESVESMSGWEPPPGAADERAGVLVVEEEPAIRAMLKKVLESQGLRVWAATNGQEAIDVYRSERERIDAVLVDVRMSGMDGRATLIALRGLTPDLRCCFMTGGDGSSVKLWESEGVRVLTKPFDLRAVSTTVWQLVNDAKSKER